MMSEQEKYYAEQNRKISDAKNAAAEALLMKMFYAFMVIVAVVMTIYIAIMAIASPGLVIVFASYKLLNTVPSGFIAGLIALVIYLSLLVTVKFDFVKSLIHYGIVCAVTSIICAVFYFMGVSFAVEMKSIFWNPPFFNSTSEVSKSEPQQSTEKIAAAPQSSENAAPQPLADSMKVVSENISTPIMIPSFDCNKAHSITEIAICGDSELANLDAEMAQKYKKNSADLEIQIAQKEWIKEVRNPCAGDKICLINAYKSRISQLN